MNGPPTPLTAPTLAARRDMTTELRVRCMCGYRWIAAYLPMRLDTVAVICKCLHCAKCGRSADNIYLDLGPPPAAVRTGLENNP